MQSDAILDRKFLQILSLLPKSKILLIPDHGSFYSLQKASVVNSNSPNLFVETANLECTM